MEFYQKFQEFQSLTYLDLSSNNIGDQGLRGLVSKNGWKSPNLTVLKISKINIQKFKIFIENLQKYRNY